MRCPFNGKPCIRAKEIHVTETDDGEITDLYLCRECGVKYIASLSDQDHIKKIVGDTSLLPIAVNDDLMESKCPDCGTTVEEILETAQAGCAKCYEFHEILHRGLVDVQGDDEHRGKLPKKVKLEKQMEHLKELMKEAIEIEWYEEASNYRNEIDKLQDELRKEEFENDDDDEPGGE